MRADGLNLSWGLGFRVSGLGFRVWGLGFWGLGVPGVGFRPIGLDAEARGGYCIKKTGDLQDAMVLSARQDRYPEYVAGSLGVDTRAPSMGPA